MYPSFYDEGVEAQIIYEIQHCSLDPEAALLTVTLHCLLPSGQEQGAPCNTLGDLQEAEGPAR